MPELDITLLRMAQLWCAAILFGAPLFSIYGPREALSQTRHIVAVAAVGMLIAAISAVAAQTVSLTGVPLSLADAIWYLTDTRIGKIFDLRFAALFGYLALIAFAAPTRRRSIIQVVLGGALLGSFAWTGHAAGNTGHAIADLVHLLAAGVWFGALIGLSFLLMRAHQDNALIAPTAYGLKAFSNVGVVVVAVLIVSGVVNALFAFSVSNLGAIPESGYVQVLLLKLALLIGMLALASLNRFRLAPQLKQSISMGASNTSLKYLRHSIFAETAMAVVVLGLAASLASTQPPG